MTEENKQHNIAIEVAKAESRLVDANTLLGKGSFDSAVSMSYFAAFHYARALILMEGLEAKSHSGVVHLVNQHFVLCGRLSPEAAQILGQLQTGREHAEYDVAAVFTEAIATKALERARRFVEQASQILKDGGYLK